MMMIIIAKQWCIIIMCGGLMRRCCNFEFKCLCSEATAIVLRHQSVCENSNLSQSSRVADGAMV